MGYWQMMIVPRLPLFACAATVWLSGCGVDPPPAAASSSAAGSVARAAGRSGAQAQPRSAQTSPDAKAPGGEPAPGVAPDGSVVSAVQWFHGSLEDALAHAKASDKLVFVDVGAYWCPPCHRLDEEVFTDPAVGAFLDARYVAVHIDAEKGEGPQIVERYKVQAYPTMLVLEASGLEKGRIVDFVASRVWVETMTRLAAGGNVLSDVQAQAEAAPDDLAKQVALGHAYALAARREDALRIFDAVLVADPRNELGAASKVLYDRALFVTAKLDGKPDAAIAEFRALQARFPAAKQSTSAYAKIGRLLNRQGKPDEAIEALDAMLATDPTSVALHASYGWFSFRQRCGQVRGLEVVREGLTLDAQRAELHYLSAELSLATGDGEAAVAAIQRASELEPDSAYYKRQVRRIARERVQTG